MSLASPSMAPMTSRPHAPQSPLPMAELMSRDLAAWQAAKAAIAKAMEAAKAG